MQKFIFSLAFVLSFLTAGTIAWSHQPELIYQKDSEIEITNPEISRAFYDELKSNPRSYFISSEKDFNLNINILIPEIINQQGRYSANIFLLKNGEEDQVAFLDGEFYDWQEFYESFNREYYLKGPEFEKQVPAGKYKIEVFSSDNTGRYVLAVGKEEYFDIVSLVNLFWQIPLLKVSFFETSVLQFFLTPVGIAGVGVLGFLIIFFAFINYIIGAVVRAIKNRSPKTLFLASSGMEMRSEIIKMLQKPAYNITVAFITTASKPKEDLSYVKNDLESMREMGFNVQEVDIEGKTEKQLTEIFQLKDIIFVEGGNTFYLLKAMRKCHFAKIMKKLLKHGKVYIGSSAGSIVAGRTIKTAEWYGDLNLVKLISLKGLNLVPFDIFVHYNSLNHAEIIKKKLPWKWQRKKLKILTDEQAILVQGRQVVLIGEGNKVEI